MAFPKRKNLREKSRQKLVIVGSSNPVKIHCAEEAFQAAFEDPFIIQGLNVNADVNPQPFGEVETYTGAYNRAFAAKKAFPEGDFWVGIEGGIDEVGEQMVAFAWIVVLNNSPEIGKAKTATFFLPEAVRKLLKDGVELGDACDTVFSRENSKVDGGAVGLLTNGVISRKSLYKQGVLLALIPFLNEGLYG